jgi:hypothetical protein
MSQSFAQVRSLIAAKVDALSGFNLVKMPPQYFGRVANTLAHKGFTVDVKSSQDSGERQRRVGPMMQSIVNVSFAYRLRPKDMYPTDYDAALDAEEDVIRACLSSYTADIQIRYVRSTRVVQQTLEYAIHNIEFSVLHTLSST